MENVGHALFSLSSIDRGKIALWIVATTSGLISILSSIIVLSSYFFILWYRPPMVNRISLRLIVFSCFLTIVFLSLHYGSENVDNQSQSCILIIYFLIATDIMACMCLAMVGLNLVTIFIVRVKHPARMEKFYYVFIVSVAAVGTLAPLGVNANPPASLHASCWYHIYFYGRLYRVFKWVWYYGCILFALTFAAVCSAMAIIKFCRRQDYFVGTINMSTRSHPGMMFPVHSQFAQKTTVIVRKVVLRCICYPLIPLISKAWGVGIQIALIQGAHIPFAIYCLDAWFSNFLGFMVSVIYFTDPSVIMVAHEICARLKHRYVYEYYCVDMSRSKISHYPPSGRRRSTSPPKRPSPTTSDIAQAGSSSSQSLHSFSADVTFPSMHYEQNHPGPTTTPREEDSVPFHTPSATVPPITARELKLFKDGPPAPHQPRKRRRLPMLQRFTHLHHDDTVQRQHRPSKLYKVIELADNIPRRSPAAREQGGMVCRNIRRFAWQVTEQCTNVCQTRRVPMHRIRIAEAMHRRLLQSPERRSLEIWRTDDVGTDGSEEDDEGAQVVHTTATTAHADWTEIEAVEFVEPYNHPKFAKLMHWLLVAVLRTETRDKQSHVVELVELFPADEGQNDQARGSVYLHEMQQRRRLEEGTPDMPESSAVTTISSKRSSATSMSTPTSEVTSSRKSKGKGVAARSRPQEDGREPHAAHVQLQPGKDTEQRTSHGRFLLTVTDETGDHEHHEFVPPSEVDSEQQQQQHRRPRLLRGLSGGWSSGTDKQQHRPPDDDRGGHLAKGRPAKPATPPVLRISRSSPDTEASLHAPSTPSKYPSSLKARPRSQYDQTGIQAAEAIETDGVPLQRVPSVLIQDFLDKHRTRVDPARMYRRPVSRESRAATQFISTIGAGFMQGVTDAIYVSNWEHDDERIRVRRQTWSFEDLVSMLMRVDN